jgi:hypothetical protein
MFRYACGKNFKVLELIGSTAKVTHWGGIFQIGASAAAATNFDTVIGELDFSGATNGTTNINWNGPIDFRIKPGTIKINFSYNDKDLTNETIQSIIDGLVDMTGQTAQILTLHADVKAKLTEEQIATITNKNWTLA